MDILLKACAAVIVSLVLLLILEQRDKHVALLLCVAICCMLIIVWADFLQPIVLFFRQIQRTAALDSSVLSILLKSVGITLICEITSLICIESGYGSLGKVLQFMGMAMVLYVSLPLFHSLLDCISQMLGGL